MADIGRLLASFAGGALEGGVNAFDYNKQQEEKKRQQAIQDAQRLQQDLLFKQGQEDRTRQQAATAYQTLQQQGQQALTQGNYSQAQQLMPKMYEHLNAATGLDLVGPRLAGKMVGTGQEQARPNQGFTGPMPEKLTMGATPDLSNPKNKASLDAVFGYTPPAPKLQEVSPGASLYRTAKDGSVSLVGTAPYPENPYKLTADQQIGVKREGIAATGARQERGIAASGERQSVALNAQDTKAFQAGVNSLAAKFPTAQFGSGLRTHAEQQALWDADLKAHGGKPSGLVAQPGHSAHETGLARDVAVPPELRAAFIQEAQALGYYVKADYPDGHVHIGVPQGSRPVAPAKGSQCRLVEDYQGDGTAKMVPATAGTVIHKKPAAAAKPRAPKAWTTADEKNVLELAAKEFPSPGEQYGMAPTPEVKAQRNAYAKKLRAQFQRQSGGESKLSELLTMMEQEKALKRGEKTPL